MIIRNQQHVQLTLLCVEWEPPRFHEISALDTGRLKADVKTNLETFFPNLVKNTRGKKLPVTEHLNRAGLLAPLDCKWH